MGNRETLTNPIFRRIAVLLVLAFFLFGFLIWFFFQTSAKNIGLALFTGHRETALKLIENYIGDPPSKLKAGILARMYGMYIIYEKNNKIKWAKGTPPPDFPAMIQMDRMMHGMGMMRMMRRTLENRIVLKSGGVLTIYIPLRVKPQRYFYPQLLLFLAILFIIGATTFLFLRKTLSPLNEIIKASEKIGMGDLSYRIRYDKKDDFKRVVDAFNSMAGKLGTMLAMQREMLHVISHELRTPLARMALAAEMKNRDRAISVIKQEINEINSLIEQVLELSRIQSHDGTKSTENINLRKMIEEIIEPYRDRISINGSDKDIYIQSNKFLLEKIISNLVENAIKYSPAESKVEIQIGEENEEAVLSVKNEGPGIPEDEINKIWEPFYRGSSSKIYSTDGKGLGLVIVKKAVELLGAKIYVKSHLEGPTIFTLKILAATNTS